MADRKEYLIMVLVLETIGANLGSMMTPIGNPQNLYLFGLSGMTGGEFLLLMLPYTLISLLLLMAATFIFVHNEPVTVCIYQEKKIDTNGKRRLIMYGILFLLALCSVVRIIPFYIVMGVVAFCIMIWDRDIISKADYSLIFTFIFLFIFIGNMKRIPIVSTWLSSIVTGRETITAVLASQVISNVPAAILLPGFTKMIPSLIIGTNLGGLGTLIASMASLISFKLYDRVENCNKKKYLLVFTILNLAFLAVLFGFYLFNKSLRFH